MLGALLLTIALLVRLFFDNALQHFRIGNRRRDHVSAAGPLAQIDEPAALAAEGKVF